VKGWRKTTEGWQPLNPRTQQILFQIIAGRPFKEIAEQFNITISAVSHIRARAERPRRINPRT
jgi:FixJ family two-component response regulator